MSTVGRNRNHLARMTVMPGLVAVISLPAAPAAADTVVRCTGNPSALQPALAAASAGDTLRIEGTCRGTFVVDRNLTLSGKDNATLDGNGAGPVLSIGAGTRVVVETLTVTGGVSSAPVAVGGIANAGRLEMRRSTVKGNVATGEVRATARRFWWNAVHFVATGRRPRLLTAVLSVVSGPDSSAPAARS